MLVSEKIQDIRKKQGMSQEELAEAMDVSRQTISNWETGVSSPSAAKLKKLGAELGVSVAELLGEEPPTVPKETVQEQKEHPVEKRTFWAVCILSVCLVISAAAVCIGIYITNTKLDRLLPPDNVVRMEDLKGEEVDVSEWEWVDVMPLSP